MRDSLIHLLHFYSPALHHISDDSQGRNQCHIWMYSLKLLKIKFLHIMLVNHDIDLQCIYMQLPTQHSLNSYKCHSIIWNYFGKTIQKKQFMKILITDGHKKTIH